MAPEDCTLETRRRLWRHMTTSMLGVLAAFVVAGAAIALAKALALEGTAMRITIAAAVGSCLVLAVGIGWWSTFRNLRCPSCNEGIWWQVSWNTSLFAARASKHCRQCGVRLFDERSNRFVVVLLVVAFLLGMVGAILNIATHR
jgi:hypothetical protein